jgi:hypothetical protein
MRYKTLARTFLSLLLLLTTFHVASSLARAADDDNDDKYSDDDGYEETARVARVSLIAGDVSLRRAGSDSWERAELNKPLVEGDRLATGSGSRVEIQIDAHNFVRVGEYATLDIVTLRDAGVALSLPEGTATLRLARFDHAHEYFEIDAPGTTVAAEQQGLYRLDVDKDGKVRVVVREGGRARLYSESSGFTLRDGRTAELVAYGNSTEPDWEFSDVRPFDDWDTWVDTRERDLLARLRYDNRDRYYDSQVYGAEELDAYGDWVQTRDYGYVWRPRATTINIYNDWAPYRYGHWDWCPPYGWVWVGDEPWGWAPYHYGRWVNVDNYWCWAPRGYFGYHNRSWWRPALVAFVNVNVSFGNNICWYPLPYHHSDPRSNFWRRALNRDRLNTRRHDELANLQRLSPVYGRAVSGLPARDFGRRNMRPRPADAQSAKLALATDPVRGRLPVIPVDSEGGMTNLRGRLSDGKRATLASRGDGAASGDPSRRILERPTGAAKRLPGTALDDELRRARIFNNREPVISKGAKGDPLKDTNGGGDPARRTGDGDLNRRLGGDSINRRDGDNTRGTGAVARPARRDRQPDPSGGNGSGGDKAGGGKSVGEKGDGEKGGGSDPARSIRPVRTNPDADDARPRDRGGDSSEHKTKPNGHERSDDNGDKNLSPYERPARPEPRESRPSMPDRDRERSEPRNTPREERREPPAERREPMPERRADPAPRQERPEPRHEERSAPREERSAPPREERSSPPPREERSAPSKSEERSAPSKSEDRHSEPSKSEPSRGRPPQGE